MMVLATRSGVIVTEESVLTRFTAIWTPLRLSTTLGGVGMLTDRSIVREDSLVVMIIDVSPLTSKTSFVKPLRLSTSGTGFQADWSPAKLILNTRDFFVATNYKMSLAGLQDSWGGGGSSAPVGAIDVPLTDYKPALTGGSQTIGLMPGTTAGVAPLPVTPALTASGSMYWDIAAMTATMGQSSVQIVPPPAPADTLYAGMLTVEFTVTLTADGVTYLNALGAATPNQYPIFTFGYEALADGTARVPALTVLGSILPTGNTQPQTYSMTLPVQTINPADLKVYMSWALGSLTGAPAAAGWMTVLPASVTMTPLAPVGVLSGTVPPAAYSAT